MLRYIFHILVSIVKNQLFFRYGRVCITIRTGAQLFDTAKVEFYQTIRACIVRHKKLKGLYFPGLSSRVTYVLLKLGLLKVMGQDFLVQIF